MKFILATKNKSKLAELKRILLPLGCEVISESDLDYALPEPDENADTFEGNAMIKAMSAHKITGLPAIADDSGLCVDYLNGEPGVLTARYAGEPVDNNKNNEKLLKNLLGVPMEKRTARFVSAIAVVLQTGESFTVRGVCEGKIGTEPKGNKGFGYDPLFISEKGCFGVMDDDEKDSISHRGAALRKMAEKLKEYL